MNEEMRQDLKDQIRQKPHWFQDFDHEYIKPRMDRPFKGNPDPLETPDDVWDDSLWED